MDNVSGIYSLYSHRMAHGSSLATSESEDLSGMFLVCSYLSDNTNLEDTNHYHPS
jgi:hypothetical protein